MLLMLIDTRGMPPEPDRDRPHRDAWLYSVVEWLVPWPAAVIALTVAALTVDSWIAPGFALAAVVLLYREFRFIFPTVGDMRGGMRDYKQ